MTSCLLAWAEEQFDQAEQVNGHGITQAQIRAHVEKTTGRKAKGGISPKPLPAAVKHIWEWFLILAELYADLDRVAGPGIWVQDLISLTGMIPHGWEIQILAKLLALWAARRRTEQSN